MAFLPAKPTPHNVSHDYDRFSMSNKRDTPDRKRRWGFLRNKVELRLRKRWGYFGCYEPGRA
jgi:hypothetical protein